MNPDVIYLHHQKIHIPVSFWGKSPVITVGIFHIDDTKAYNRLSCSNEYSVNGLRLICVY